MKFFTVEEIALIHMQIIDASGGSHGIRDVGRLESAVAAQTQSVYGKDLYYTAFSKAAALAKAIIADHAFVDGNKRTGIMLAVIFLERNSIHTQIADFDLENFAVQIAVDHLSVEDIAIWLQCHSEYLEHSP
jgi:death-on-curing protein